MGVILAVGITSAIARAEQPGDVTDGRGLFVQHCQVCHGSSAHGDGPLAEDLKIQPADLTQIAVRHGGSFPDAEIGEVIDGRRRVRGHGVDMPVWGDVFSQRTEDPAERRAAVHQKIADLVAYLRSLQVPPLGK